MRIQKDDITLHGSLYGKGALFDGRPMGTARNPDTHLVEFEFATNGGHMMVTSTKTGRTFILSWQDALQMALRAGVDSPGRGVPE